ncbi:MAG: SIS domain-containing protein [Flavobacteriales bacterium]|nr:SIS domain-containing protein [Flavobacteriales bacterium]
MLSELKTLLDREVEALQNIPIEEALLDAVELIYKQVHQKKGKVVIAGMGKAGQIGMNMATTFSSTGTPAIFIHPMEAQHGDLGVLQPNDVLLLISNSGVTDEVILLAKLATDFLPQLPIISLTGNREGKLHKLAQVSLITGRPAEICPLGLTPTTSTTVMTVIGDLLVVTLMKKIGFTKEEYAKRHHSGYLGIRSRQDG